MRAWNVGCSMKVQRMISPKQKIIFFSCLTTFLFAVFFSNGVFGNPSWDIEFLGDTASYSSGSSIDVVLQITARAVFKDVTVSINLPYGWSVSSGPSEYKSSVVTEKSTVGWTVYGGSKESLDEITATVTSINPAVSETVKLSAAGALPRVDSVNSVPSDIQPVQDDVVEPAEKEEELSEPKTSFFNFTRIKKSIKNLFSREKTCEQVLTYAKSGTTGECREFSTPCDVPEGWKTVESCYTEPVVAAPDNNATSSIASQILRVLFYIVIIVVVVILLIVVLSAYRLYSQRRAESDGKRYSFE